MFSYGLVLITKLQIQQKQCQALREEHTEEKET